jgi:hypothetical protein
MNGKARVVAAPTASAAASGSAATDPAASAGPVGVAAPKDPVIADFDAGTDQARFGDGWKAVGDGMRGGTSKATERVIPGGAAGTAGALEVTGTVVAAIAYPFAGTAFAPVTHEKGKIMDFRGRDELRFFLRGDGKQYMVIFNGGETDGAPPMYGVTAGPQWQEVRIPLAEVGGLDPARIHSISIGLLDSPGDFRFDLDGIELR